MGVVRIEEHVKIPLKRGILQERGYDEFEFGVRTFWKTATGRKGIPSKELTGTVAEEAPQPLLVCVTSGASFLSWHIADRLSHRGYTVRIIVDAEDDLSTIEESEALDRWKQRKIFPVVADLTDVASLREALDGCAGVFHTSSFVDPSGVSGYTKHMAEKEAEVARKVVEAGILTASVKRFVFTSSLLACIWRRRPSPVEYSTPVVVDESWWSDEEFCAEKKLWLARGKTMAEKTVWAAARGTNMKVASICPALVTGPGFCSRNTTSSIAYLKGGREMYADGLLATADVRLVADAHVAVYETMRSAGGRGRYVCFDRVFGSDHQAAELCREVCIDSDFFASGGADVRRFCLSDEKLRRLLTNKIY